MADLSHKHRNRLLGLLAGLALAALLGAATAAVVLLSGAYSTAATKQHFAVTHWLLEKGLRLSVWHAADVIVAPSLTDPALVERGAACFIAHCLRCHGAPGVRPEAFALGMLPAPTNVTQAGRDWTAAELFWVISKGIRMTGMPAWEYRLSEDSRWATVAFVQNLPQLTRARYESLATRARAQQCAEAADLADVTPEEDPDPDPRRTVIRQYACHACHRIEGIVGPDVQIGPPLEDWPSRGYVAGVLPNTPDNLVRWIRDPQGISPGTLMPDLGVTEAHARSMASFLFSPRQR